MVVGDHATWWVETTKISAKPPLESFILFKIRPKRKRRQYSLKLSQYLCIVTFLFNFNIENTMGRPPIYR